MFPVMHALFPFPFLFSSSSPLAIDFNLTLLSHPSLSTTFLRPLSSILELFLHGRSLVVACAYSASSIRFPIRLALFFLHKSAAVYLVLSRNQRHHFDILVTRILSNVPWPGPTFFLSFTTSPFAAETSPLSIRALRLQPRKHIY